MQAKAGVAHYVRHTAVSEYRIRVNANAPGPSPNG
jgi:NAD(P)-dependent dehydrogenase (short-subunit alcohol dehydrogenase family)